MKSIANTRALLAAVVIVGAFCANVGVAAAQPNLVQNANFGLNSGGGTITAPTEINDVTTTFAGTTSPATTLQNWYLSNNGTTTSASTTSFTFVFPAGSSATNSTADAEALTQNVDHRFGGAAGKPFTLWGPDNTTPTANGFVTDPNIPGQTILATDGDSTISNAKINQQINGLTVGGKYALSFDWAGAQQLGHTGPTTEQFSVSFGSQSGTTNLVSIPSKGFSGWQTSQFTFNASSASQVLSFLALGLPSNGSSPPFLLLSNVNLSVAAPEIDPASGALPLSLLAGLMLVAESRRRRSLAI